MIEGCLCLTTTFTQKGYHIPSYAGTFGRGLAGPVSIFRLDAPVLIQWLTDSRVLGPLLCHRLICARWSLQINNINIPLHLGYVSTSIYMFVRFFVLVVLSCIAIIGRFYSYPLLIFFFLCVVDSVPAFLYLYARVVLTWLCSRRTTQSAFHHKRKICVAP